MQSHKESTILEVIAEDKELLEQVLKGVDTPYQSYLCRLILNSHEVAARRNLPWTFKSLMEYGEEDFCKGSPFRLRYGIDGTRLPHTWHGAAAQALGYEVCRSILYEHEEGLILFVREGDGFRPAKRGDGAYDFVKRLYADANVTEYPIDKPVAWAAELFVSKLNLDAYACLWHDLDYLSKPGRGELKQARREAVWRETLRLLACEPYTVPVPDPAEWGIAVSQANTVSGAITSPVLEAEPAKTISDKERDNLLRLVGALLELVQCPRAGRTSDAAVIKELIENYGDKPGMSQSNLERKFPEAKRVLRQANVR